MGRLAARALSLIGICLFGATLLGIVALWLAWGSGLDQYRQIVGMPDGMTERGVWGDSFGAFNALFAALGFAFVAVTLFLQVNQNRFVVSDQHRQRFESSFFELLKLLREARSEVRYLQLMNNVSLMQLPNPVESTGILAFDEAWHDVAARIAIAAHQQGNAPPASSVGEMYKVHVHDRFEQYFGPYFRLVYTILYRIREDKVLTRKEKFMYGNLLRSQLTSYEIALIGVNGLSSVSKDMKKNVIWFRLLKYVPRDERREVLEKYYPARTFAGRRFWS